MDAHPEDAAAARAPGTADPRRPWWTPRAIGLHVTLVVVLPLFAGLFWWQVQRVRQGNMLSWAYVFEWPFFAAYAVYLWWRLVHEQPEPAADRSTSGRAVPAGGEPAPASPPAVASLAAPAEVPRSGAPDGPAATGAAADRANVADGSGGAAGGENDEDDADDADDQELAAYNRYLAALDASGRRKRW